MPIAKRNFKFHKLSAVFLSFSLIVTSTDLAVEQTHINFSQLHKATPQEHLFTVTPPSHFPQLLMTYLNALAPDLAKKLKRRLKNYEPSRTSKSKIALSKRSEVRNDSSSKSLNLETLFAESVSRFSSKYKIGNEDLAVLERIAEENREAIENDRLQIDDIFRAHFEGPRGAIHLLNEKMKQGLKSWSELLFVLEMYPDLFERIYIDLDSTLFAPGGYVGSETWMSEQIETYGRKATSLHVARLDEEKRLVGTGSFSTTEPGIAERIMSLKKKGVTIFILAARHSDSDELTQSILKEIGVEAPVIYTRLYRDKSIFLKHEFEKNKKNSENNKLKTEGNLTQSVDKASSKEAFEEFARENLDPEGKLWVLIDDKTEKILSAKQRAEMEEAGFFTFPYGYKKNYELDEALEFFEQAYSSGELVRAKNYAIDALSLFRFSKDANRRYLFYKKIYSYIKYRDDDRLTMAYIESITDFLAHGLDEEVGDLEELLTIYFNFVTPYNPEAFIEAYRSGHIKIHAIGASRSVRHGDTNYEITIDSKNLYVFLEPLLRYVRSQKPDVVILPDTGARPFLSVIKKFLTDEGLNIPVIILPISRNTASDTVYEIRRWLKLAAGEITPANDEEERLSNYLSQINLRSIKNAKNVAVLDDNITSGETVEMLLEVLKKEGEFESLVALTPFAFSSPQNYPFSTIATFKLFGNYAWSGNGGLRVSPPLIVNTAWECAPEKRGVVSRRRFQYPPATLVSVAAASEYQQKLLEDFEKDSSKDKKSSQQRPPILPKGKVVSVKTQQAPAEITVSSEYDFLPDELEINETLTLSRKRGRVLNSEWIHQQNALSEQGLKEISEKETLFYEIKNSSDETLGFIVLGVMFNSQGDKELTILKIQSKMETETQFDPVAIVEALKRNISHHSEANGIKAVYVDVNEITMISISQSHWIRKKIRNHYNYLPRGADIFPDKESNLKRNNVNLLWQKTNDEQEKRIHLAKAYLHKLLTTYKDLYMKLTLPASKTNLFSRKRIRRIKMTLDSGLPPERQDYFLLRSFFYYLVHQKKLVVSDIDDERAEAIRTKILYDALAKENENSEEGLAFPESYFSRKLATFEVRAKAALDYYLNHLWSKGADLSGLTRQQLNAAGLGPLFSGFNQNKGELLEFISPSCYHFLKGVGYVPNPQQPVTKEMFQEYLNGKWYRVAPGMVYKVTGDEKAAQTQGWLPHLLVNSARREITFIDDPNHGLIGVVKEGEKVVDYLYLENGYIRCVCNSNRTYRTLGWLDVIVWGQGRTIKLRPANQSYITLQLNRSGRVAQKKLDLNVSQGHGGKEVVGVLKEDINHGVILNWYLNDGTRENPTIGKYLNTHYFYKDNIETLVYAETTQRNLGWLDVLKWLEGEVILPRPEAEGFTSEVTKQGAVVIDSSYQLYVGRSNHGKQAMVVFREDLNYGIVLEVFLKDGTPKEPRRGDFLNAYYKYENRIYSLNKRKRTFPELDFVFWKHGLAIKPRPFPDNQIVRKAEGSQGTVLIMLGMSLTAGSRYSDPLSPPVLITLREDLNHGVVVDLHESRGTTNNPIQGDYITGYYRKDGKILNLNEAAAKKRQFGWLDIVRWKQGHSITPRPDDQSCLVGHTDNNGNIYLRRKETFTLGKAFKNMDVIGILKKDINHGVIMVWYENKTAQEKPKPGKFLTAHYFEDGKIHNLNTSLPKDRTLGWLDITKWLQGKKITPRLNEESLVTATVSPDGSVFFEVGLKLRVGENYVGKKVVGILQEDEIHGTVLEWYLDKNEGDSFIKGDKIQTIYRWKGKNLSIQSKNLGWLDFLMWTKGSPIKPRHDGKSFFTATLDETGVLHGAGISLTVGNTFKGKNVVGILRDDINHGTVLYWYENLQTDENAEPMLGEYLNAHYWSQEENKIRALNIGTGNERTFGWLDVTDWLRDRDVKIRPADQSSIVGRITNGRFGITSKGFEVDKALNNSEVMGILRLTENEILMDLYGNIGTRQNPKKGNYLCTYDKKGQISARSELRKSADDLNLWNLIKYSKNVEAVMFFSYEETIQEESVARKALFQLSQMTQNSKLRFVVYGVVDKGTEALKVFRHKSITLSPLNLSDAYQSYGEKVTGYNLNVSVKPETLKQEVSETKQFKLQHILIKSLTEIAAAYIRVITDPEQSILGLNNPNGYYEVSESLRSKLRTFQKEIIIKMSA